MEYKQLVSGFGCFLFPPTYQGFHPNGREAVMPFLSHMNAGSLSGSMPISFAIS